MAQKLPVSFGAVPFDYPIMLDVSDRRVVIFGGGGVAVRKVKALLGARAKQIVVISLTFHPDLPGEAMRIVGHYSPLHLQNADLIFAATDVPEVNDQIVVDCRARKIWVNRADAAEENAGDFSNPAALQNGAVFVTVSAGGNPAVAAQIRDEISKSIHPQWIALANAMQHLRPKILEMNVDPETRSGLFRTLATHHAAEVALRNGEPGLLELIQSHLRK